MRSTGSYKRSVWRKQVNEEVVTGGNAVHELHLMYYIDIMMLDRQVKELLTKHAAKKEEEFLSLELQMKVSYFCRNSDCVIRT